MVNQPIPASPILIAVPAGVAINTYTATLSVNNGTCTGTATYPITVVVNAAPTLATVSQSGTACASSTATINLTGMVPNATGNTVNYTIGATPGSAINVSADAGGNASFTVPVILANNGATFTVVSITDGCTVAFGISFTPLVVTATPTITLGTNPSVCFSAAGQNANLPYSATTLSQPRIVFLAGVVVGLQMLQELFCPVRQARVQ